MQALTPKGYSDVQEVEAYLSTDIATALEQNVLNWIREIEAYIERETGRVFIADAAASARWYDGSGLDEQRIDECVEITEVKIYDNYEDELFTMTSANDYFQWPYNELPIRRLVQKERSSMYFYKGQRNVKITAKWGYSVSVPELIRFATTVLASGVVNYSSKSEGEISSERIGEYSVTYKNDSQWADFDRAKEIIKSYRKPNV